MAETVRELLAELDTERAARAQAERERDDYRERKDAAYEERNRVVAALSRLFPSHLARHPEDDASWERDWMTIVCIHSPAGQLTWHVHDSQRYLFAHLTEGDNHWDGHTTPQKYERLSAICPSDAEADLAAECAARQWQDIASAPKDRTRVLVCRERDVDIAVYGSSSIGAGWWVRGERCHPTHWMPLPTPPEV